jgi:hypothetical protein
MIHGYKRRGIARVVGVLALLGILVGATQSYAQPWTQVQGGLSGMDTMDHRQWVALCSHYSTGKLDVQLGPFRDRMGLSILETYRSAGTMLRCGFLTTFIRAPSGWQ